jgi:hypothetical protein
MTRPSARGVQGIAAQIAAMGLVQTSDTGQINWVTVARPALNTIAGYEIWRFNDAFSPLSRSSSGWTMGSRV